MFRLAAQAYARLTPEAQTVAEVFLGALPPFARSAMRKIELFGNQARRFEPDLPFDLLVVVDEATVEIKTALSIAASMVESAAEQSVMLVTVAASELEAPSPSVQRALQNARREGVALWHRTT